MKTATKTTTPLTRTQPLNCAMVYMLPSDLHVNILTYLRAYDLVQVHRTCRAFSSPQLTHAIVQHSAEHVYPQELTEGFDSPLVAGSNDVGPLYTYENLKSMEMLVVARVLSRPDPTQGFYVCKSWCKAALRWLEVQQEQHRELSKRTTASSKRKLSKKQQRIRNRRLSDASPPWPNVNSELLCPHENLQRANNKQSRARRRVLDKQAWKVLKRLYPDSKPLESVKGECLLCLMEDETTKRNLATSLEREKRERKQPLSCPLVRGIYTRSSRGVPIQSLQETGKCPLTPGVYFVLPRSWCYKWRRYLKLGEGTAPFAPCASALLCDAHRFPLIPPHLESFLYGESLQLLGTNTVEDATTLLSPPLARAVVPPLPVGMEPDNHAEMVQVLRAAGLSETEVASQRMAMMNLERRYHQQQRQFEQQQQQQQRQQQAVQQQQQQGQVQPPSPWTNQQLDRENSVVVEIVTASEWEALALNWPKVHANFVMSFTVSPIDGSITWSTPPCRDCDASGKSTTAEMHVKNRARCKRTHTAKAPTNVEY